MVKDNLRNSVIEMLVNKKPLSSGSLKEDIKPVVSKKPVVEDTKPEKQEDDMLEELAVIEHDQWMEWAKNILETETISEERADRWRALFIPYEELSEEAKEQDRKFARKVLGVTGKEKVKDSRKPKDLGTVLNKVFENQAKAEVESLSMADIEKDVKTILDRDVCKEIFEAMF